MQNCIFPILIYFKKVFKMNARLKKSKDILFFSLTGYNHSLHFPAHKFIKKNEGKK